jgi:hypothetical protein
VRWKGEFSLACRSRIKSGRSTEGQGEACVCRGGRLGQPTPRHDRSLPRTTRTREGAHIAQLLKLTSTRRARGPSRTPNKRERARTQKAAGRYDDAGILVLTLGGGGGGGGGESACRRDRGRGRGVGLEAGTNRRRNGHKRARVKETHPPSLHRSRSHLLYFGRSRVQALTASRTHCAIACRSRAKSGRGTGRAGQGLRVGGGGD